MNGNVTGGVLLLVEDDDSIGRLVKQYLEQQDGWRVVWLRTGEEAMTELRRHPVRLVVLDIGLPGMDGFEVCRRMRAHSKVPIVMLTARDEEPDRVAGLEIGADDYVAKPFSPRELAARIKAILRRTEQRSEDEVLAARDIVLRRDSRDVTVVGLGDRADRQGVRPARLLPRAPGHRALARAAARPRLGDDLPRRHAHRRRARRAASAEARRPGDDPHRARSRVQAPDGVKPRASLRSRLFQAIALIVLLCVGLTLGLGLLLTRRAVDEATLKDVAHQADLIAGSQRIALSPLTHLPELNQYFARQHETYLVHATKLPAWAQAHLKAGKPAQGSVTIAGTDYFFAAQPVGNQAFVLLRPKSVTKSQLTPFVEGLLIATLAGGALAAAAAFVLARRIARPVGRVADAARSLAGGTYPDPIPLEGAAELATLAGAFNDLAVQLFQAREAERNFLLSVSHELKTPLTAIRGYSEALRDGAVTVQDATETVALEAARLERLVGDLLDLARMNRTDFSVHNSEIDLSEVADDAVRRYLPQADAFGVALTAFADGPAPALADADRVLQVVSNLVENALRLAPPGGEIRLVTAPGLLRVEDTGPGLKPEEHEHAFERFYLHERYGRERPVGTGLGLAIVKELTQAMGGTVEVASVPGGLTTFTVRLAVPARQPAAAP